MNKLIALGLCFASAVRPALAQVGTAVSSPSAVPEKTDGERINMLLRVGSIWFQEEDYHSALEVCRRILAMDPGHKECRYMIGMVYFQLEQYKEAVESMISLLEEDADDFRPFNNLAWIYAKSKDPAYRDSEKAIRLAQEAMVLAPYNHHVWSTLSEAYFIAGEYEKAVRAIRHLANLATTGGAQVSKEMVDTYNEQLRKCARALETQKFMGNKDPEAPDQ